MHYFGSVFIRFLLLDNGNVASASTDKLIIWNLEIGVCIRISTGHTEWVKSLCQIESGELISGSLDKSIKIWNLLSGEGIKTLIGHTAGVTYLQTLF